MDEPRLPVIAAGDLMQLNPATVRNKSFAGCILVVDEQRSFGVIGYVQALGERGDAGGQAYYVAFWDEIEPVGKAKWFIA